MQSIGASLSGLTGVKKLDGGTHSILCGVVKLSLHGGGLSHGLLVKKKIRGILGELAMKRGNRKQLEGWGPVGEKQAGRNVEVIFDAR